MGGACSSQAQRQGQSVQSERCGPGGGELRRLGAAAADAGDVPEARPLGNAPGLPSAADCPTLLLLQLALVMFLGLAAWIVFGFGCYQLFRILQGKQLGGGSGAGVGFGQGLGGAGVGWGA